MKTGKKRVRLSSVPAKSRSGTRDTTSVARDPGDDQRAAPIRGLVPSRWNPRLRLGLGSGSRHGSVPEHRRTCGNCRSEGIQRRRFRVLPPVLGRALLPSRGLCRGQLRRTNRRAITREIAFAGLAPRKSTASLRRLAQSNRRAGLCSWCGLLA